MFGIFKKKAPPMYLFVGLGNPGNKYQNNRHNIGFLVLDDIATDYREKFQGLYTEQRIDGGKVGLLKPMTYMNESGQSVAKAAKFYKIPPENIIVFHDELDLKPGEVRTKFGGGTAGHNGLKSIKAHLGTPDFWRIRIGIGHPGDKNLVSNYVLSDFAKAEEQTFEDIIYQLSKHIKIITTEGIEAYGETIKP